MKKLKIIYLLPVVLMLVCGCRRYDDAVERVINRKQNLPDILTVEQFHKMQKEERGTTVEHWEVYNKTKQSFDQLSSSIEKPEFKSLISWEVWDGGKPEGVVERFVKSNQLETFSEELRYSSLASFYIEFEKEETLKKLLGEWESMGYSGLIESFNGIQKKDGFVWLARNNIRIDLSNEYYSEDMKPSIAVNFHVPSMLYPKKYTHFLGEVIVDGFYVEEYAVGMELERIGLAGSQKELYSTHDKRIVLYFNKGKLIQIEILFESNNKNKANPKPKLFSPAEKQTVHNLIEKITGNRNETEKFLNNFELERQRDGSIGDHIWKLKRSRGTMTGWALTIY